MKFIIYLVVLSACFWPSTLRVEALIVEDLTPPEVVSITTSTFYTNTPYTVTVTFSESVAGSFDLSDIDSPQPLLMSGLTTADGVVYTFLVAGPTGSNHIRLRNGSVQDIAGNVLGVTAVSASVIFDTVAPAISVTNGVVNNAITSERPEFDITVETTDDTLLCALVRGTSIDDAFFFDCSPDEGETTSQYAAGLEADGVYTFAVKARDELGNESTPSVDDKTRITFTYDTTTPNVFISVPVVTPSPTQNPTLTLAVDEQVTLAFIGSCGLATPNAINTGSTVLTFGPLRAGVYSVGGVADTFSKGAPEEGDVRCFITVTDRAGHAVYVVVPEFTLTAPEVAPVVVVAPSGANGPISIVTGGSTGGVSPVVMTSSGEQPNPGRFVLDGQSALTPTSGLAVVTPPAPVVAIIPPPVNPVVAVTPVPRPAAPQTVRRIVVRPQPRNNAPVVAGASITNGLVGNGVGNTIDTSVQTASASDAFGSFWEYIVSLFY